jgi:hypothetical protein
MGEAGAGAGDRPRPKGMDATDRAADSKPGRNISAAPSPEGNDRASGEPRSISARDLQGESEAEPGSDADQANQSPHVG